MTVAEPKPKLVVVATHGHCFDGAASAAVFSRLLSHLHGGKLTFFYKACGYTATPQPLWEELLGGDINALLDYRYSTHARLNWYFDHHATAFANDSERQHFEQHRDRQRFHDPTYGCCARLIADVARDEFGFESAELAPLVHWAHLIDTASFESAEQAIERDHPILHLMTVIEHQGDSACLMRLVPRLASQPLEEIANDASIQHAWKRFARQHRAFVQRVRLRSRPMGNVVFVDLTDEMREVVGKFVTYALYPESSYSVILTRGRGKIKLSVGFNPWSKHPRMHDISAICARHGGGGHPMVGAIAMPLPELERAREAALAIVRELNR